MKNDGPKPDPRHLILQRLRRGDLTREQAEAEAQAAGFPLRETHPDPADYDPIIEPFWTLPMTLAWIIHRSDDAVRNLMESFVAATRVWRHYHRSNGQKVVGLFPPMRKSAFDVINEAVRGDASMRQVVSGINARNDLLRRLKSGEVKAFGIPLGQREHQPIPPISWETITTLFVETPGVRASDISGFDEEAARYQQVRIPSRGVRQFWQPQLIANNKGEEPGEPPPRLSNEAAPNLNAQKRIAVDAKIQSLGIDVLAPLKQKDRESRVIDAVKLADGLTVSDRFVRKRWGYALRNNLCS